MKVYGSTLHGSIYEMKHSRMDQVKFVEDAFKNFEGVSSAYADHTP